MNVNNYPNPHENSGYGREGWGRPPYGEEQQPNPAGGAPMQYMALPAGIRRRSSLRPMEVALFVISLVLLAALVLVLVVAGLVVGGFGDVTGATTLSSSPPANTFSVIRIEGAIFDTESATGSDTTDYKHQATLKHIKELTENADNTGILLYLNTPGGGVYESDEIYRALMHYKEETGRPVQAYMAQTCASGGYYVCMAADHIAANYNTSTGSIGVYTSLTDTSGLYEKLGVRSVLIRSGSNKAVGTQGVEITPEQEAVFKESVDESYDRFISLVGKGRGMEEDEAKKLSDGRIYTAQQALKNGLVDELGDWDTTLEAFKESTESNPFYPNFGGQSPLDQLLVSIENILPLTEAETALNQAEALPSGVPLAYEPTLAG